jgi:hypothetical protein
MLTAVRTSNQTEMKEISLRLSYFGNYCYFVEMPFNSECRDTPSKNNWLDQESSLTKKHHQDKQVTGSSPWFLIYS